MALACQRAIPSVQRVHAWWRNLPPLQGLHRQRGQTSWTPTHGSSFCACSSAPGSTKAARLSPLPVRKRMRLDELCVETFPEHPLSVIQSLISRGNVLVDNVPVFKPGTLIRCQPALPALRIRDPPSPFVCRAGVKLQAALERWEVPVRGASALDAGISTGGFTDCLLQAGVERVLGVDVGTNMVADRIARDPRVTLLQGTNLRHLRHGTLPFEPSLATLDLSFISLASVARVVSALLSRDGAQIVALVKPQFEAERSDVLEGGVVQDPAIHARVIAKVQEAFEECGFVSHGHILSPIKGRAKKNSEFLVYFTRGRATEVASRRLERAQQPHNNDE